MRPATPEDAPFLTQAILAAEGEATGVVSYGQLFSMTGDELAPLFTEMLGEEDEGHELTYTSYLIFEAEGRPVATCAAWVEHNSAIRKAQMLGFFVPPERWAAAKPLMEAASLINIPRTQGAVQLESFYVAPEYRGQGLTGRLIEAQLVRFPDASGAQIILLDTNANARRAYEKAGFAQADARSSDDPQVRRIFGANGKILMEKTLRA